MQGHSPARLKKGAEAGILSVHMTKDLTTGKPLGLLVKFSIPLLLGNIFQQFYNIVDAVIVGKFVGLNSLTAVGASASVNFLILGFCIGSCYGFTVPIAQRFGAKDYSTMRRYIVQAEYLAGALAVIITVVTAVLCGDILHMIKTPAVIYDEAYIYQLVIFLGIPFTILYNLLAAVIRALGDSKTPFIFLAVATVINIFGDLFCVVVLKMGVLGAALATVASQALSGLFCLIYMRKKYGILRTEPEERRPNARECRMLLAMGVPTGLVSSITAIGSIMLQSAVNGLSVASVSAYAVALKLKQLFICPYDAIGSAMGTFVGQNLGAGKIKRIREGLRVSLIIGIVYSAFACLVMNLFVGNLAGLFMDTSQTEVLAQVKQFLSITSYFYWILDFLCVYRSSVLGMGHSALAMYAGLLEMLARTAMSIFVIPALGFIAVCYTDQTAWFSAAAYLVVIFYVLLGREVKKMAAAGRAA